MKAKYLRLRSPKGKNNLKLNYDIPASLSSGVYDASLFALEPLIPKTPWTGGCTFSTVYNNKIYLVGGQQYYSPPGYIHECNPLTQTFAQVAVLPQLARFSGFCVSGNKIYITGGLDNNNYRLTSVYVFDMDTMAISLSDIVLPVERYGHTVDIINGYMYMIGGYGSYNTIYTCNLSTNTWTLSGYCSNTMKHSSVVRGNNIYIFGGTYDYSNYVGVFTCSGTSVSVGYRNNVSGVSTGDMPAKSVVYNNLAFAHNSSGGMVVVDISGAYGVAGTHLLKTISHKSGDAAFAYGGLCIYGTTLYAFGGDTGQFIEKFDLVAGTEWERIGPFIPDNYTPHTRSVDIGNKIYVVGGWDPVTDQIMYFDTDTNSWTICTYKLQVARSLHSLQAVGTKIYVFGGTDSTGTDIGSIEVIDTVAGTSTLLSASLTTSRIRTTTWHYNGKIYVCGGREFTHLEAPLIEIFDIATSTISTNLDYSNIDLANARTKFGGVKPFIYQIGPIIYIKATSGYNYCTVCLNVNTNAITELDGYYYAAYIYGAYPIKYGDTYAAWGGSSAGYTFTMQPRVGFEVYYMSTIGYYMESNLEYAASHKIGDYIYFLKAGSIYKGSLAYVTTYPVYTPVSSAEKSSQSYIIPTITLKEPYSEAKKLLVESQTTSNYSLYVDPLLPSEITDGSSYAYGGYRGAFSMSDTTGAEIDTSKMPTEVTAIITADITKVTTHSIYIGFESLSGGKTLMVVGEAMNRGNASLPT